MQNWYSVQNFPMTTFQKITSAVAGASLLAGAMLTLPTQAATSYVQGHGFLQGHSASGGANFLKDFMGYYTSSDSVRLFSDETIRNIFKNDTDAGRGYVSSRVVVNPSNTNVVYFTTNETGLKDQGGLPLARFRVNLYDFSAKKMTILYTKDYPNQGDISGYDVIGSEGGWLVMEDRSDNSPGPCANVYTSLSYVKMDMSKPSAGLMKYTFPKEIVDAAQAEAKKCEADIYGPIEASAKVALATSSDQLFTLKGYNECFGEYKISEPYTHEGFFAYDLGHQITSEDSDLGQVIVQTKEQAMSSPLSATYKKAFETDTKVVSYTIVSGYVGCTVSVEKN
jgi:hypothetical protein